VDEWQPRDPIRQFRSYLIDNGVIDEAGADQIDREVAAQVDEAVEFGKSSKEPSPDILMDDIYA
jgi:TPP-dependent pyruvate/acetoin dehydrogenase alpha subunit